ncbi:MAG: DUF4402 domain-containing protein [Gammaproteobacteria bacterium]|nr:DUF4402 domain-containing protein [Gammaproteobacteria bacterium]
MPHKIINALSSVIFILFTANAMAAKPPPSIKQCKSKWVLTSAQAFNFGAFAIDSGAATLMMDNTGTFNLLPGNIATSTTVPVTNFTVTINNTVDPLTCGAHGFTISWGVLPTPLAGPGTAMPLTNVLVSEATLIPTATALPVILNTANLPITLTFQGNLNTTFPQAAGTYISPVFTVDLTQDGTITSVSNTASATSLTPIGLTETLPMNFGTVAGGSLAGTVIMNTAGARTVTGDGNILATGPGNAGSFQITGEPNLTYALLITGPAVLESAGGQQVTATAFTNNSSGTIPAAGIELFQVGATLNLGPLQAAGTYSTFTGAGSPYTVTVNYN